MVQRQEGEAERQRAQKVKEGSAQVHQDADESRQASPSLSPDAKAFTSIQNLTQQRQCIQQASDHMTSTMKRLSPAREA